MCPAALCANVALMCTAVSPEVLLGPLCLPKRQHLSALHFLHGEHMNTANQSREWQSGGAAGALGKSAARHAALAG